MAKTHPLYPNTPPPLYPRIEGITPPPPYPRIPTPPTPENVDLHPTPRLRRRPPAGGWGANPHFLGYGGVGILGYGEVR